jgi:DNA-binding beta-propeller fold protein YncE
MQRSMVEFMGPAGSVSEVDLINPTKISKTLRRNPVKKTAVVPALIALTLLVTTTMTQAAMGTNPTTVITNHDNSGENITSVKRPGAVSGGSIYVHPFIDLAAIRESKIEIFVSDAENNVVNIYNTSGKLLGQIVGLSEPQGLASDGKANLYIADTANSRIQIYAPPYNKKPTTLGDPGEYPSGVAVTYNGEFVAVANILSTTGGPGDILIFKKGKAGFKIVSSALARPYFCAFDAKGNLYVDGENSAGQVVIGEIANATKGGKKFETLRYTGAAISFPGGIVATTRDKIAILDQEASTIYTFNQPVKGSLGSPIATTVLTGASDIVTFAFTASNKDLWGADAGTTGVAEFAYPASGNAIKSFSEGGEPIGVALVPAEQPEN